MQFNDRLAICSVLFIIVYCCYSFLWGLLGRLEWGWDTNQHNKTRRIDDGSNRIDDGSNRIDQTTIINNKKKINGTLNRTVSDGLVKSSFMHSRLLRSNRLLYTSNSSAWTKHIKSIVLTTQPKTKIAIKNYFYTFSLLSQWCQK